MVLTFAMVDYEQITIAEIYLPLAGLSAVSRFFNHPQGNRNYFSLNSSIF
jgi:hypothetical protein